MPNAPRTSLGTYSTPSYIPATDEVRMPRLEYFFSSDEYYSAFFHELVHSTGHKKRLGRFETDQYDSRKAYYREELVAELGAAYLSVISGIKLNMENTSAYIKGWLKVLEDNPSWIVWASSKARKSCEWIVPSLVADEVESNEITL